ncbi:MAG: CNNM domain-containing protein [Planctomycetota bacterium]|jgi:CBS domain containing-hemolysin-like protein
MIELAITIVLLLAFSFLCSVLESVILSITKPYIQTLIEKGNWAGKLLGRLKDDIEEPISAILTLNTISHTVGAAVSGALALKLFGSKWMALFSAVLTFLILVLSEIIPKTLGARYWKQLAPASAVTLRIMIWGLKPVIVPIHFMSRLLFKENPADMVSKGEILNFIRMGYFQGVIRSPEFRIVENLFQLQCIPVSEIMTPRSVVFTLPPEETVAELHKKGIRLQFSRIPLLDEASQTVQGVVLRREIMDRIASEQEGEDLASFASRPAFIEEGKSVYLLLNRMVSRKVHLAVVRDAGGKFTGIVTLEDALETLLGREIVDEFDPVPDMRELAREESPPPANSPGSTEEGTPPA